MRRNTFLTTLALFAGIGASSGAPEASADGNAAKPSPSNPAGPDGHQGGGGISIDLSGPANVLRAWRTPEQVEDRLRAAKAKRYMRATKLAAQAGYKVGMPVVALRDVTESGHEDLANHEISPPDTSKGESFDPAYVHGAKGERGVIVGVDYGGEPTVRFERTGTATLVSHAEVVPLLPHGFSSSVVAKRRLAQGLELQAALG